MKVFYSVMICVKHASKGYRKGSRCKYYVLLCPVTLNKSCAGQRSSPESRFANKTKKFSEQKIKRKITGP